LLLLSTEVAYQEAKKEVDKHAQLRDKYFKEAEEAYAAGDKDKARELRGTYNACTHTPLAKRVC
jgi:hypothetical protein